MEKRPFLVTALQHSSHVSCGTTQSAAHGKWAGGTSLALPEPQVPYGEPGAAVWFVQGGKGRTLHATKTCHVPCHV